jgi:hypothetical protein
MRPLTHVQNPKQARWFPVNSAIPAVNALRRRSFRLPVLRATLLPVASRLIPRSSIWHREGGASRPNGPARRCSRRCRIPCFRQRPMALSCRMSPADQGLFRRCADRGCGHVFGLSRGELDPLALMLSADPLPHSRWRACLRRQCRGLRDQSAFLRITSWSPSIPLPPGSC